MQLQDRVAIITGSGSGIGEATAVLFAEEGARVVVAERNREAGLRTVDEIGRSGGTAIFCETDVAVASQVENLIRTTWDTFGALHTLVNNAAVQVLGRLADTSEEDWDRVHAVNLRGVFLCSKYGIPAMIRSGGGSIVNIASVLAFVGDPDLAAYCAAKGGVVALTKAAAMAYGPQGIRMNCVAPGDVNTPMVREYFASAADPASLRNEIMSKYALRRIAEPAEVARTALFLASDASSFMTGAVLVVDGGLTSKCY
jgi:meso-butanediol dehydrogenase / (S,S)-butanediol dehydrogenase / diacetyl reductase